tara:strand:+ start:1268 stop:1468 length:201 start_codon:yes stop_codon:yes gene_type:complete
MPKGKYERDYKIPKDIEIVLKDLNRLGNVVSVLELYGVTRSAWDSYMVRNNIKLQKTTIWAATKRD